MAPPAPDPETRPKPILSNKLELRPPGIPPERLPKAIDRSGEKKAILTTHVHLAPKEKPAIIEVGSTVMISSGGVVPSDGTAKLVTKGKPRK